MPTSRPPLNVFGNHSAVADPPTQPALCHGFGYVAARTEDYPTPCAGTARCALAKEMCAMYTQRCAAGPLHRPGACLTLGSDGEGDDHE
jgi:hypothetical protein